MIKTSAHPPFGDGVLNFDGIVPALAKLKMPHDWWTIDLCFWSDAWPVTKRCKQEIDKLNRKYGGPKKAAKKGRNNRSVAGALYPVSNTDICTAVSGILDDETINIGLIGYEFHGPHAFQRASRSTILRFALSARLKAVCARNEEKVKAFADTWGYESWETDWRKLIKRDDIDVIDIGSPNNTHAQIAIAAAQAGKMILCEKPLSMNGPQGLKMVQAIEKAGVPNMVWYNYRRVPPSPSPNN